MIKLEVSGETPQAFFGNVLQTLAVLAKAFSVAQGPTAVVTPAPPNVPQITNFKPSDPVTETNPLTGEPMPELKRKPTKEEKKAAKEAEKKAKVTATPPAADAPVDGTVDGGVPDFLSDLGDEPPAAAVTLDDVRNSIRAYNKAVAERGETLEAGVSKITPLFKQYKIAKVSDLKPEQYAEFKAAVQPYIDGTA